MKIFIDCTYLRNKHTGVDEYFFGLIVDLLKLDQINEYTIFVDSRYDTKNLVSLISEYSNYKINRIYSPLPLQILYASFLFPIYTALMGYSVYHNPYFFGPLIRFRRKTLKIVITVHDLYYQTRPNLIDSRMRKLLKVFAERAIKKADSLIVISKQTQSDIVQHLGIDISSTVLIYQALRIKNISENIGEISSDVKRLLNKRYIYTVGLVSPHKGLDDLLTAFHKFKNNTKDGGEIHLVSAGKCDTKFADKVRLQIDEYNLNNSVHMLGYVTNAEMDLLYKNSELVVVASHYEGFGFPVLEGMSYSRPVIVRKASSLIEVMGDDGWFFHDISDLASKLDQILNSKEERGRMIEYGNLQLRKFSSEERARKTLLTYQ